MRPPLILASLLATAAALVAMGWHVLDGWSYISEDAFLSLRQAERLLQDGAPGDALPMEGGPLWVLLVAGLGALGLDLVVATRLLGLGCTLGAVAILGFHLRERVFAGAWVAGLSLAASSAIALGAVSGLEPPLLVLLLAWALAGLGRALRRLQRPQRLLGPAVALSLACLTRPDALVLALALGLGWWMAVGRAQAARQTLLLAGLPLLAFSGHLLLQLLAQGTIDILPARAGEGASGVSEALALHGPLLLLAALSLLFEPSGEPRQGRLRLALPALMAWTAWTAWIGGDIDIAFRNLAAMVVILAWMAGAGALGLAERSWRAGLVLSIAAPLLLGWMVQLQHRHSTLDRAEDRSRVQAGLEVGGSLGRAFADRQPLLATPAMGALPYASGLATLDLGGRHRPLLDLSTRGRIGPEPRDGDRVFFQRPDIVLFCGPAGSAEPCSLTEKQLAGRPDWKSTYALVTLSTPGPAPTVFRPWVRRQGQIGIRTHPDRIEIPGWLLTELGGRAIPGEDGRFELALSPGEVAGLAALPLPAGRWEVLAPEGLSAALVSTDSTVSLQIRAEQEIRLASLSLVRKP